MKYFYLIFATLMLLMISHNGVAQTKSATKPVSYAYKSGDMSVKGMGIDKNTARSNASEQCFKKRMDMFEKQRGQLPDEDQALMIIDSCVNI